MNKPRPDSLYSQLKDDQRALLYDWILTLGYTKTKERIARPEPEGFNLKTHLSCLHAFYLRYAAEQDLEQLGVAHQVSTPAPSELFPQAVQAAHAGAFRLATAPTTAESFSQLSQWVSTQQANDLKGYYYRLAEQNAALARKKVSLAESRLELDRERFRYNAARQALIHFAELAVIARSDNKDNEDKIRAVANLLFRPPATNDQNNQTPALQPAPSAA